MKIEINNENQGLRLDITVYNHLIKAGYEISRSNILDLIEQDVKVNSESSKKGYKLMAGDVVEIEDEAISKYMDTLVKRRDELDKIVGQEGPLDIVLENENLLIVNKPKGIIMHPAASNSSSTLANYVRGYLEAKGEFDVQMDRAGLVHRLDKGVSGLVVFAKNLKTQRYLQELFSSHKVEKIYHATVEKLDDRPEGPKLRDITAKDAIDLYLKEGLDDRWEQVEGYIQRDYVNRTRMKLVENGSGRYSLMYMKKLSKSEVLIKLETGRMHQIRASLKTLGYIIEGDTLYRGRGGENPEKISLKSVFLRFPDQQGQEVLARLI